MGNMDHDITQFRHTDVRGQQSAAQVSDRGPAVLELAFIFALLFH